MTAFKRIISSYKNEKRARIRRALVMRIIIVSLTFVLIIGGAFYFIFFAGIFDIRKVEISAPDSFDKMAIESSVNSWLNENGFIFIPKRNNFELLDLSEIGSLVKSNFVRVQSVETKVMEGHTLSVIVTERVPLGVWCHASNPDCFYFDDQGVAFMAVNPSSGSLFAIVEDHRPQKGSLGQTVLTGEVLSPIQIARRVLQYSGLGYNKFILPENDASKEIDVQMNEGWLLKLNYQNEISDQIEVMLQYFKEKLGLAQRKQLRYIDLRIKDRIYYQ